MDVSLWPADERERDDLHGCADEQQRGEELAEGMGNREKQPGDGVKNRAEERINLNSREWGVFMRRLFCRDKNHASWIAQLQNFPRRSQLAV